jgi:hypothetical protein
MRIVQTDYALIFQWLSNMKAFILTLLSSFLLVFNCLGQNEFPKLNTDALANQSFDLKSLDKSYTVVLYGGLGCGYSKFLIQNLHVLNECKAMCDIILIMDQPKDSLIKHMPEVLNQYPVFSNAVLQYRLKKKQDIFPQLLVFKNRVQINHIVGVKEGMLTNTKKLILEGR